MSNESAEVELPHVYCATFTRVANEPHRSLADQVADRVIARIEDRASNLHSAAVASAGECERLRSQVAEQDRRIEDLRVSLIRAINTALSRAGVELPTSAAATVESSFESSGDRIMRMLTDVLDECRRELQAEREHAARLESERDELRAAVKALEDWRADVTVALQRPGGALFADVPKHVRDLVAERDDLERQLAKATEWRPMCEHIAEPTIVAWEGQGGRVGVYGACNFGPLPAHQHTDALGWLPIPPYRAKKEGQ